jgi:putative FmdB family regulatory protein
MPIYDYRCDHCGHVFSAVQSFSDEALRKCPNCGKEPRRLLSTPAIVFKGSGWYKTDSRAPSKSAEDGGSEKKGGAKPETKGETKAETKSDAKTEKSSEKPAAPKSEAAS